MCEMSDFMVFHPKIAISTVKTKVTAVASVPIGMRGENIPKYEPRCCAADRMDGEKPVLDGKMLTMPPMRPAPRFMSASVIMWVCECRASE